MATKNIPATSNTLCLPSDRSCLPSDRSNNKKMPTNNKPTNIPIILSKCEYCNKRDLPLSICTGCKDVYYCSAVCQKADWRGHRESCDAYMTQPRIVGRINEALDSPVFMNALYTLMNKCIAHYVDEHLVCQIFKTENGYRYDFEHRYTRKNPDKNLKDGLNVILYYAIKQRPASLHTYQCVHTINRIAGREETDIAINVHGKDSPLLSATMPCSLIICGKQVLLMQGDDDNDAILTPLNICDV